MLKLNTVNTVLRTYTGEVIPVVGECELEVKYNGFKGNLPAVVISGEGPCLLGRNCNLGQNSLGKCDALICLCNKE